MSNWYSHEEYMDLARKERLKLNPKFSCTYGMDCLDQHLKFIHPTELVLIGCESGKGKTTFISNLVIKNASIGKKIAFFKLEGDICEFVDTQKWKYIYNNGRLLGIENFSYIDYRYNNIKGIEDLECKSESIIKPYMENILLYSKKNAVNAKNLEKMILEVASKVDMIAIDHLHYFDMFTGDKYEQEKAIMKVCNEVADRLRKPILIVSHLRKKVGKDDGKLPGLDDYMGSSNIPKIAHTAIILSPNYAQQDNNNNIFSTFIYSPKNRAGASTTKVFVKKFDGMAKDYIYGFDVLNYRKTKDGFDVSKENINLSNNF